MDSVAFPIRELLEWYRRNARVLPWRVSSGFPDPYHTLVSEAMLQQTQVATVIPYFLRFITEFPTIHTLADADEQEVLTLWQGLGYYRRARHLHAAARMIRHDFNGQIPNTVEALLQLPGVGRYSAGAIASIAFATPAPLLDGNVARVIARFDGIEQPVDQPAVQKKLWERVEQVVTQVHAQRAAVGNDVGDFNQALMELGATVCLPGPGQARCLLCPLRDTCKAHAEGAVDRLPMKLGKKRPTAVRHVVIAVRKEARYLFEQRGDRGLWAGMWQCPTAEDVTQGWADALRAIEQRTGIRCSRPCKLEEFEHATTHRAIRFCVYRCDAVGGRLRPGAGQWRRLDALNSIALSNPQRRVVAMLGTKQEPRTQ